MKISCRIRVPLQPIEENEWEHNKINIESDIEQS